MFKQVMKYHKNVRFVNFIRVCKFLFSLLLEFFKGSVILRSTHCEGHQVTNGQGRIGARTIVSENS